MDGESRRVDLDLDRSEAVPTGRVHRTGSSHSFVPSFVHTAFLFVLLHIVALRRVFIRLSISKTNVHG